MRVESKFVETLKGWLEHSPSIGPQSPELSGWAIKGGGFACTPCIGRLLARGVDWASCCDGPVWKDSQHSGEIRCDLCGNDDQASPADSSTYYS